MPGDRQEMYPDIKLKTRLVQRICRIATYIALLAELLLIVINYYTYPASGVRWSIITGGAILYLLATMWELVNRRKGHIQKIYLQIIGALALILCIDYVLGFSGWSLEFGLPCVILCIDLLIVVCMAVNFSNWQNYLLLQMFAVLLGIVDLVLLLKGIVGLPALVWSALGISAGFWTGTLILGDRKAAEEMKRKFHI